MKIILHEKLMQALLIAACSMGVMASANAQQYLRIGTGGTAGTYYPIGKLVAGIVSRPDILLATAQASNGSLGNVIAVSSGALETGFSQADVATWAMKGTGIFEGRPGLSDLRLIANLYPESMHVVVRKDSGIQSISDLKGKRVALDEPGSGTLISARQILAAYHLQESDLRPEYIKPNQAGDRLIAGTLDAFSLPVAPRCGDRRHGFSRRCHCTAADRWRRRRPPHAQQPVSAS